MSEQETQATDDEIVYQVNHRNPFNVFLGDIGPDMLLLILSYAILKSDEPSVFMICIGILLLFISIYFLLESLTFKELVIYKDRVVVNKLIFGKSIINIEDIERIDILGYVTLNCLEFVCKKTKRFLRIKYSVTALSVQQTNMVKQTIKNLQGKTK